MKVIVPSLILAFALPTAASIAADATRASSTVVLSETGVQNLRIETVEVEETTFEEIVFSLGQIEHIPIRAGAVSSRIPGRIVDLKVSLGDTVKKGDEIARVESRQPGDPPPVIPLTAPLNGLVTSSSIRLGQPVEPENALLEITDLSEVYAVARVPETQAGKLKPGTIAHIKITSLPDKVFDGELLRFGTAADSKSGTIDAVFRLPNPEMLLRPGMRAEFSIVVGKRENVASVPRIAVQGDASNRFVYVKDFELPNAFVKTPVSVGEINDQSVEILNGLFPGDEVVTEGSYSLGFAGGGNVSLKEALDAAHGHTHAADGSEPKEGEQAGGHGEGDGHNHDGAGSATVTGPLPMISYAMNGILVLLLIISNRRKPASPEATNSITTSNAKEAA